MIILYSKSNEREIVRESAVFSFENCQARKGFFGLAFSTHTLLVLDPLVTETLSLSLFLVEKIERFVFNCSLQL